MSKILWKGSAQLSPVPAVLVTCGTAEKPNVFTVAWTGIVCTQPPKTYISVRPERFSHALLLENGEFVINLTTAAMVRAVDYCGVRSGRNEDKFAACRLLTEPAAEVAPPVLCDSPAALECRVTDRIPLGSHDLFLADIVAVRAEEELLDEAGRLCLERARLLAYSHGSYHVLGERLGGFGDSVRKKPAKKRTKRR